MKRIFTLVLLLVIIAGSALPQEVDKYGYPIYKKLSEADLTRLLGDQFNPQLRKTNGDYNLIKQIIVSGNKITTVIYNYGSICKPNTLGNIADLVWQNLGYGFEFGPLVAAEVVDDSGNTVNIVDDSFILTGQGDYSPDGTIKWGWLPKAGYVDPAQDEIASLNAPDADGDGKPDSWPERWYNAGADKYIWPAFLGDQATAPDEEVYFVVDDYTNAEFDYFPFINDNTKRGLGLDMEVRILQFNNALAEDIMFLVYNVVNRSDKNLDKVYFGMHGDPHVGGPDNYSDDRAGFIDPEGKSLQSSIAFPFRARNMVFSWDDDMEGMYSRTCGYFGWKFLESPTNSSNSEDDDVDGLTDESPYNSSGPYIDGITTPLTTGITNLTWFTSVYGAPKARFSGDEDGDWDPLKDDIGIDGIAPTSVNYPGPDYGEADGKPSQGWFSDLNVNEKYDTGEPLSEERIPGYVWAGSEPGFGYRDISESDQIGLTSFHPATYTNSLPNVPKNDPLMWEWLSSDTIDTGQELLTAAGDNIFNFGSGPLKLEKGESQRFSMAILFGDNLDDLILNAETSTRILESDYRFAKPPEKPKVKAVAGKDRVTLYWDNTSELSFDPFLRANDFQGYKIYRSRDYSFSDVYTITDANGVPFIGQAFTQNGIKAQFDIADTISGLHPVEYVGRGVKFNLGSNTGLVHEYVDSSVTPGVTYYYAVAAYDGGSVKFDLSPSECQTVIEKDPITNQLIFDVNTVQATAGGLAEDYKNAKAGSDGILERISGNSTGVVSVKVLNDLEVQENRKYDLAFVKDDTYNLYDVNGIEESFTSKDTVSVGLSKENLAAGTIQVFDANNALLDSNKYSINLRTGRIKGAYSGALTTGQKYKVKYNYFPVYYSSIIDGSDGNPTFDGMKIYVTNDDLQVDYSTSGWSNTSINVKDTVFYPPVTGTPTKYRADWKVVWNDLDTANGTWKFPGDTVMNQTKKKTVMPFKIINTTTNQKATYIIFETTPATRNNLKWDWGESIIIQPQGETGLKVAYQLNINLPDSTVTNPVYPKSGDIYYINTLKPFQTDDKYTFTSKAIESLAGQNGNVLDKVTVVPNPYVAYSIAENPGLTLSSRGERVLQFRNLPAKCTIRIFTITGELVQKIEKDDLTNSTAWDLLSNEGQRIAYGIYIYHIDAPGIGEKIGRLAVIK
ncbi:MAG: hypothetical protein C4539_07835 [Ignavibacteriales bacterium]|nr:MAG: hypothetical protein C4539_07835 [Ignavibacteriales bacterium]